jgi:hypothetical protein
MAASSQQFYPAFRQVVAALLFPKSTYTKRTHGSKLLDESSVGLFNSQLLWNPQII